MARAKLSALGEQQAAQGTVWLIERETVGGFWVPHSMPYFNHHSASKAIQRMQKQPAALTLRIRLYVRQEAAGQ